MSDDNRSLQVYIQLVDQLQSQFRGEQKEIEKLWSEICDLRLLAMERPLEVDEASRLTRAERQYSRKANIQSRNLDSIKLAMVANIQSVKILSTFRDERMQQEIFGVLSERFLLETTRIFGDANVAREKIREYLNRQ